MTDYFVEKNIKESIYEYLNNQNLLCIENSEKAFIAYRILEQIFQHKISNKLIFNYMAALESYIKDEINIKIENNEMIIYNKTDNTIFGIMTENGIKLYEEEPLQTKLNFMEN
ncbi:MAG: hypothetical protein H8E13_01730 [Actinobacteria bacterium]|nr:hypothetical protein [Actinomycetota bacterium]